MTCPSDESLRRNKTRRLSSWYKVVRLPDEQYMWDRYCEGCHQLGISYQNVIKISSFKACAIRRKAAALRYRIISAISKAKIAASDRTTLIKVGKNYRLRLVLQCIISLFPKSAPVFS
jgi:hypothetical protein